MKKLSTKTIATLTVVTAAAATVPGLSRVATKDSQFDKLLQRHDRKGEIRAGILNMTPHELKKQLRRHSFDEIIRKSGMTERTFRRALLASLRNELRNRGWTTAKIDEYIQIRSFRTLPIVV
jgi:hypothetical protein